jgi:hypothetical protein
MHCSEVRPDLSPLADDALDGERAAVVRRHLRECLACRSEFSQLEGLRSLVAEAGRVAPPPDLALAIRVRISQDRQWSLLNRMRVRFQNLLQPVAVPALAGVLWALVFFGVLIHTLTPPLVTNDIPLVMLNTPPRLVSGLAALDGVTTGDAGLLISVYVDQEGRPLDYYVLNPPTDPTVLAKLRNAMLFARFEPATSFGIPRPGTMIFSYRSISIKG